MSQGITIFIYRPDKRFHAAVNPDMCYTISGQNFREWQRDKEEVYNYRVEQIKCKLNKRPSHKVEDYWR